MYTIRLENTITHQIYEQQVQDNNNGEKLYFRFGVSTFDLVDGEYILTLLNAEGDVLAEDLMRIGDYNPEALQYSKGENTYIDVTLNAVLQEDKYVTINEIETRIVPDLGNDAIETVYVNAQPVYDWGYNEGYTTGYDLGNSEGYPNGYADGYESGRTDGYNEGYDVGSMDMHLEMLEETRILNVTENGRYFTKYTEDPYTPTGDGDFSDFCKLTNTTYQMGRLKSYYEVQETGDDVIEFWWKPKDLAFNHRPQLLMSSLDDSFSGISHSFSINLLTYDREDKLRFNSNAGGGTFVEFIISDPEMWYHILLEDNGVYVNDEYVGKLATVNDNETSYVYINGDTRNDVEDGIDECNGYFGMVKINGEVFIPTENGYMDQNTGNIIQPIEGGEYEYLRQRDPEGGLYRTVNVNIDTKQFFLNGYDEATQKIMDGVQDITITENGNYLSKFSDPIYPTLVTGMYNDGTEFYSYAELYGATYNTKIAGTIDSRLEFWYKGDNKLVGDAYNLIIGSGEKDNSDCFQVRYQGRSNNSLWIELGNSRITVSNWDDTVWHHLIISKAEGLWIDDEKKGDFSPLDSITINGEFFINGIYYDQSGKGVRKANGTFGMIKIDDIVIIPTADGFRNVNTGELLEVVQDGGYKYTENLPKYGEGGLFKTINVNVAPKVNVSKAGIKFGYSKITEVPDWADFDGITDFYSMFIECGNLKRIPVIDTSQVTDMTNTFRYCSNLETIPLLDTSKVTTMDNTFWYCTKLSNFPPIDTSSVKQIFNAFGNCYSLTSLPALNMQSLNMYSFYGIFGFDELPNLINFGGFLNLKQSLTDDTNLKKLPNLTYESCINVLNGLYDFVAAGETPNGEQGQLKVHQNFLDKVGDEISIGTNKGWTITA